MRRYDSKKHIVSTVAEGVSESLSYYHLKGPLSMFLQAYKKVFSVAGMLPKNMSNEKLPSNSLMYKTYISMAIPSVLEMVLISLINMADTIMVSTIGTDAVAAVGLVAQPRFIMLCFFWALNTGVTAVVARRIGEGRQADANLALRSTMVISFLLSLVLCLIFLPFSDAMMLFAGAEEGRTLREASEYFLIIGFALPFNAISMVICAAQRGCGNTKLTMIVNIASNLVNILFNYLLINGIGPFPMLGVRGAAIASFIGLFVGFLLSVISLLSGKKKNRFLQLHKHDSWIPDREASMDVIRIAGASMVEQICLRIGFFSYSKIVAVLGTDAFAAHQIDNQFLSLSFSFADGLGIAGTALVGQMLGQKRKDLAYVYGTLAQRFALVVSLCIASGCIFGRAPLVSLFINPETAEPGVREMAETIMLIVALIQPFQMVGTVGSGALRGAGDVKYTARIMALTVALMRPILAISAVFLLKKYGNSTVLAGIWFASLGDILTRMILILRRYRNGKWMDIKV